MGQMFFPGEYPNNTKAKIHRCWIEQNAWENGIIGIRIHVHFEIENGLNARGLVTAYFHFSNGRNIPDLNGRFCTSNNYVAVHDYYNSIYTNSMWKDFPIFIPKYELHVFLSQSLKVTINIWQGNNVLCSKQTEFYFNC